MFVSYFFLSKGFLGTDAAFGADLNLVVLFIMGAALTAGGWPRETKTLQSSRYLPDDRAFVDLVNDQTGDVAVLPATGGASTV
jgi:hypothetical protein